MCLWTSLSRHSLELDRQILCNKAFHSFKLLFKKKYHQRIGVACRLYRQNNYPATAQRYYRHRNLTSFFAHFPDLIASSRSRQLCLSGRSQGAVVFAVSCLWKAVRWLANQMSWHIRGFRGRYSPTDSQLGNSTINTTVRRRVWCAIKIFWLVLVLLRYQLIVFKNSYEIQLFAKMWNHL